MKILITGTSGLAAALFDCYKDLHSPVMIGKKTGHDIAKISEWGEAFLDNDILFNNAYHGFDQIKVLEFFYTHWKKNPNKIIVSIGSRCISHKRSDAVDGYWEYLIHKKALQAAHDSMQSGNEIQCDLKIINPGPIDTKMIAHLSVPKMSTTELAERIKKYTQDPFIKRVDLWKQI